MKLQVMFERLWKINAGFNFSTNFFKVAGNSFKKHSASKAARSRTLVRCTGSTNAYNLSLLMTQSCQRHTFNLQDSHLHFLNQRSNVRSLVV